MILKAKRITEFLCLLTGITALAMLPRPANAQDSYAGSTWCELPDVSFWSPPKSGSEPVKVDVDFFLIDIIEINDRLNRVTLDFTLVLQWNDSRLSDAAAGGAGCMAEMEDIWHPQFIIVNSVDNAADIAHLVEVQPGGNVLYAERFTTELSAQLELQDFPNDSQTLTARVASMQYGPDDVSFTASGDGTDMLDNVSIPGWRVAQSVTHVLDGPIRTKMGSFSTIAFAVQVQRISTFYFWRLIFPLLLISLMSWSVFWLKPSQVAAQMTVATGAVFSMMALLISQGQILPAVSYMTTADKMIVTAVVLVFATFGESVVTAVLEQSGRSTLAEKIDRYSRWPYLVVVLIVFLIAL